MSTIPVIAVVDDDRAMRDALASLLEVFDFVCHTFEGSEGFLAALSHRHFDCLITDLNLAGETGLQLLQRLRTLAPALPVIIISAQSDPETRTRAVRAGAIAYLTKPINDEVLYRHLLSALGRASGRR